jgi:hypothetical protein
MPEQPIKLPANRVNESAACEICGHFGAVAAGDRWLCPDCYQGCGSCCSEAERTEEPDQGEAIR